jgi:F-type H+-transporting ATPase subunit delta
MAYSVVAARYANALADVVTAPNSGTTAELTIGELRSFESALNIAPELYSVLVAPSIPSSRKKAAVGRVADILKLSRITRNFLFVLVDRRRIPALSGIIHNLEEVLDQRLGFARAQVASAAELTEAQQAALSAQLERVTGKRIRMRFTTDPALIGGAIARIGSTVYDGSVRGQLAALERRLSTEN